MPTVILNKTSKLLAFSAFTSVLALSMSACIKFPSPGPKASAPLTSVTGQAYQKVFSDGSLLNDDAVAWSCVKDKKTGLIWEFKSPVEADPGTLRQSDNTYTWYSSDTGFAGTNAGDMSSTATCDGALATCDTQSYIDAVNQIGLCGSNEWRLPTREELISILDREAGINDTYFENNAAEPYWTTNTVVQEMFHLNAYTVDFSDGGVATNVDVKVNTHAVRLVNGSWLRNADSYCGNQFYSEKPDGIYAEAVDSFGEVATEAVIDKQTGLMWFKGEQAAASYTAAAAGAAGAVELGYDNWRVPNISELLSLVDNGCATPLNTSVFSFSGMSWSSTEDAELAGNGLYLDFSHGYEFTASQGDSHSYLLVRTAY